ncbi:MAG: hypothetical protein HFK09_03970 [Clostridia bacterium]|nr:hypothetical protein [Clostridia bacterium]
MSILEETKRYAEKKAKRWHTPGHKGKLDAFDITELDDGNLFPAREIERAQQKAADFYGAKVCRFLLGGSSMGIKAAVMSAGGDILAPHTHHRCVEEGAYLARVKVSEIRSAPQGDGLYDPPTPEEVEAAIKACPEAKAVLIVSPDYYGRTAEREIADVVHGAGKLLIADSAHGAHFAARRDLFGDGFSSAADFCVMSAHKTLFAPTMSAYIVANNEGLIEELDFNLKLLGTTSPSYPMLAALENAIDYAIENAPKYDALKTATEDFKTQVVTRKSDDFTRLVVDANAYKMSGKQMFDFLLNSGHIAEMYDDRYVVFIATAADEVRDIKELKKAILNI